MNEDFIISAFPWLYPLSAVVLLYSGVCWILWIEKSRALRARARLHSELEMWKEAHKIRNGVVLQVFEVKNPQAGPKASLRDEPLIRAFNRAVRLFPGKEGRDWFSNAYYLLTEGAPERRARYIRSLIYSLPRAILTAWWYLLSRRTAIALSALGALLVSGFTPQPAEPPAQPRGLSHLATRLRNWFIP